MTHLSRRGLLGGAGGLMIGMVLPTSSRSQGAARQAVEVASKGAAPDTKIIDNAEGAVFQPNAFVRVGTDGRITLIMPNVEMGQGIYTGASQLIAEELSVGLEQIALEAAPPGDAYISPVLQFQATGGSSSTIGDWKMLRQAGATARTMLIETAAERWAVDPATCHAVAGSVHDATGRSLGYGALAEDAAKRPVPKDVALKDPASFTLIGQSVHRLDSPSKCNGTAVFGIDVKVPGMRIGTVASCPVIGGRLTGLDDAPARAIAGVRDVLRIDNAVCVVADHYWAAHQGLLALHPVWEGGEHPQASTAQIYAELHQAVATTGVVADRKGGDVGQAIAGASKRYDRTYQQPLFAHATMEPINCTVHVRADAADVWCGTQVPARAQESVAKVCGLPLQKVVIHNQYLGGGFGRRLEHEYVEQTAQFAKQVSYPLKIVWSREEDITRDRFRPAYVDQMSAGLDADGKIVGWSQHVAGPAIVARFAPVGMLPNGVDPDIKEGICTPPYHLPATELRFMRQEAAGVVTAWWRGVGATRGIFVFESFMDELAHEAGQDPVAFRRAHMTDERARAVLDLAALRSDWGSPLAAGIGRGIAVQHSWETYLAAVIEVEVKPGGEVLLRRVTAAVDCGQVVNPNQVESQIEGGLVFGLTAALYNEITLKDGRVQQSNFNDYRMLRMNEMPRIDVHMIQSDALPGGIGETGTAISMPALANAVSAATGIRQRRLPLASPQVTGA